LNELIYLLRYTSPGSEGGAGKSYLSHITVSASSGGGITMGDELRSGKGSQRWTGSPHGAPLDSFPTAEGVRIELPWTVSPAYDDMAKPQMKKTRRRKKL
jgi:hypothetical protein